MIYSVLLVVALAAQGYARPNCFFACDYPMGQAPQPSYPALSGNLVQSNFPVPNGNIAGPSQVDVFGPVYRPTANIESFQPAGGHLSFNHEAQASQKTSISGSYNYLAPSPPVNEPYRAPYPAYQQPINQYPGQKPCRVYSDCS